MSLPKLPYGDKLRREVRTDWGGLNLNEGAEGGELAEAYNLSSREYPLLATRAARGLVSASDSHTHALGYADDRIWVGKLGNTWQFYHAGGTGDPWKGDLGYTSESEAAATRYAILGKKVCIFPAKKIYDAETETLTDMEATVTAPMIFEDGFYADVPAEGNTLRARAFGDYWENLGFRVGDAVTINGYPEDTNDGTFVIREIDGPKLIFYENTFKNECWYCDRSAVAPGDYQFTIDGETWHFGVGADLPDGWFIWSGGGFIVYEAADPDAFDVWNFPVDQTPAGTVLSFDKGLPLPQVTVSRQVPDLDFICAVENRLWGCKGDRIYASALGDPTNFNVFDGLDTDSWAVDAGTFGDFTGCAAYQGTPIFFKEDNAFRISGDTTSSFTLRELDIPGVMPGCWRSVARVGSLLCWLNSRGVCAWDGGYPSLISSPLGIDLAWWNGYDGSGIAAGSDGRRYYLAVPWLERQGPVAVTRNRLFVYDVRFGTWHEEDLGIGATEVDSFAWDGSRLLMLSLNKIEDTGLVLRLSGPAKSETETGTEQSLTWRLKFPESTRAYKTVLTGSEGQKGLLRLLIRCRVTGNMKIYISYDGEVRTQVGEITNGQKRSYVVPLILRRCDYWQLSMEGSGETVIYSISAERYGGEWQQAGAT